MKVSKLSLVALALVVMLLMACAPTASTSAPAPTNATAATSAPVATTAPTSEPPTAASTTAQSDVTLTYMASQDWITEAEQALGKKFEEQTGIHIDYQIIPSDQYFNVLQTKLNAGEATDIFGGQSGVTDLKLQYNVEKERGGSVREKPGRSRKTRSLLPKRQSTANSTG